ncbi:MAG TPA: M20/M25/M40 family metallo-hydrolase [Terriglobales bacterium]|nr:M20/M25/M40 family metallo-hydrolase [Terriglobales bacterium]
MKPVHLLIVALLFSVTARTQTANLSPIEQKMVQTIDADKQPSIDLLRQLVEINSGTKNLEGVRAVGKVLMPRFEALGFKVRWVPMDEVQRAGTLVAEHPCPESGKCGKRVLLVGHMDTVFEKDSPFQHFQMIDDHTASGPGTDDMKGGLVVMLSALKALKDSGALDHAGIKVVLSGDEEAAGHPLEIARREMIHAAKNSDAGLEFEATARVDGVYYGSTSRRGSITWRIEANGRTGHSSGVFGPEMGYGAIYELTRILDSFRTQLPEQYLTYNVGLIVGGTTAQVNAQETGGEATGKPNIVSPTAIAIGDLRCISNEQVERVEGRMRSIVAQHLAKTDATINFYEAYPAQAPTPGNKALLKLLNQVNRSLGQPDMPELDPLKRGAGDSAFVAQHIPTLAGVGSSGSGDHSADEKIDLNSLPINSKRAALLIYRLGQLPPGGNLVDQVR